VTDVVVGDPFAVPAAGVWFDAEVAVCRQDVRPAEVVAEDAVGYVLGLTPLWIEEVGMPVCVDLDGVAVLVDEAVMPVALCRVPDYAA